ncbi:GYF domain-containing protein [Verticillium dahliae VdLs.17]|uniref:GYF domain-containing protein n=2 Tax=Verticillium dahliae TaxID=27337 RepID=G2XD96_VERDV|nr:GYF domain-containing protein [Verticillium dahliae VdLs.17]EGY16964.1 GYF domain-containing protein [Verticillium dahliae VdLs.17]KAF3356249.1 Protein phosphatase 2C-like protein 2 [Verticillium dahliae VDG1]
MDEFNKWLNRELTRGGIHGVDIDTFAAMLMILPAETSVIADAIYANSKTMNGAHFAEEFVRRKRRADQGIVEKQPTSAGGEGKTAASGSGWSEVAKKSGAKEAGAPTAETNMQGAAFKVVSGRKKGSKK